ncbi:MAG: tyrosine-type recombinase/integrase, partial [Anaerolinea sp.]
VFYNLRNHEHMQPGGLQQLTKRLAKRAGIIGRVNPHAWRHTFAREYLARGGNAASLQQLMGHADVETTLGIYGTYTLSDALETHNRFSPADSILDIDD